MENHSKNKTMTVILFFIYFVILTWIILFKLSFHFSDLPRLRGINLIPLAGSVIVNGRLFYSELILNLLAFVPFGLYISMLKTEWPFWKKIMPMAGASLFYEIVQYIFAIGATDITDLINNTLGGIIGCILYILFLKVFKERTDKVLNILALIGTICGVGLLGLLVLVNI